MFDKIMEMYYKALSYLKTEKGQALVEYALILVLIAIVVIAMLTATGKNVNNAFSKINSALQ
jgi:pilus assembly protein Flp/PilA